MPESKWQPIDVQCPPPEAGGCGADAGVRCRWEGVPPGALIKWRGMGSHPGRIALAEARSAGRGT